MGRINTDSEHPLRKKYDEYINSKHYKLSTQKHGTISYSDYLEDMIYNLRQQLRDNGNISGLTPDQISEIQIKSMQLTAENNALKQQLEQLQANASKTITEYYNKVKEYEGQLNQSQAQAQGGLHANHPLQPNQPIQPIQPNNREIKMAQALDKQNKQLKQLKSEFDKMRSQLSKLETIQKHINTTALIQAKHEALKEWEEKERIYKESTYNRYRDDINIEKLQCEYAAGASATELARKYNTSRTTIYKKLKAAQ